jgi:exosortase K
MNNRTTWKRIAQLVVVLSCAAALKLYYSTASVNQLHWILAPTTFLVELVSGTKFAFESHAGYLSSDRSFLIAASCAGVNFLITSFLMLSLRRLWRNGWRKGSGNLVWRFIPTAAVFAYLVTVIANGVRISIALHLQRLLPEFSWLTPNQLHRFEGIFVYFGFLLLLFMVSEKLSSENPSSPSPHADCPRANPGPELASHAGSARGKPSLFRLAFFPLLIYYVTTLGIPFLYSAFRPGVAMADLREHSLFVLLTPLLLIIPLTAYRFYRGHRTALRTGLAVWMQLKRVP